MSLFIAPQTLFFIFQTNYFYFKTVLIIETNGKYANPLVEQTVMQTKQ